MARGTRNDPAFSVTVDLVVLTIRDGRLCALTERRPESPYAGRLALPGRPLAEREDPVDAAYEVLFTWTGMRRRGTVLQQLGAFGSPGRDPRGAALSVAWIAIGADLPDPVGVQSGSAAGFRAVEELLGRRRGLAFDHDQIIKAARQRVTTMVQDTGAAAAFCPRSFTVGELRRVYETIWDHPLDPANFHRKVTGARDFLRATERQTGRGGGRPATLYRADPRAVLHPPIVR